MDFIVGGVELGGLTLSSYLFYNFLQKQQKNFSILEFMEKARVLSPELLEKAMKSKNLFKVFQSDIQNFVHSSQIATGSAFVQGIVNCKRPLLSLNGEYQLVLSNVSSESIFSNNQRTREFQQTIDEKIVNEFDLIGEESSPRITVSTQGEVDSKNALSYIGSAMHIRDLSTLEKIASWLLFCLKLFLSMTNLGKRMTGFKVGTKKIERGILLGQLIVIFGDVFYDKMNKELRINRPRYILKDKYQLIAQIKSKSMIISRNMAMMASLMTVSAVLVIRRCRKLVQRYIAWRTRRKQALQNDRLARLTKLVTTDFLCENCHKSPKNVIFHPCMHMLICSDCFERKETLFDKCLKCRSNVIEGTRIYLV